jgi:copper(I)-binding protein
MKLLALTLLFTLSSTIQAHEIKVGDLVIVHPMVDTAEKGQVTARGSVKIRNEGKTPDQLLSISAEFADKATIEAPVPVPLPANGQAVSVSITFENIKQKLFEDAAYAGEMIFEKTGSIHVDVMVHSHAH